MKSFIYSSLKLFSKLSECEHPLNQEILQESIQKVTQHLPATNEKHHSKDFQFPEEVITADLELKLFGVYNLNGMPSAYGNILPGGDGIYTALYHDINRSPWLIFFSACGQVLFISTFKG